MSILEEWGTTVFYEKHIVEREKLHYLAMECINKILPLELKIFVKNLCANTLGYPDEPIFYKAFGDNPKVGDRISKTELEQKGKLTAVITQNIDGLHQAAGSKNVLELHGSVLRNHCVKCNAFYSAEDVTNNNKKDGIAYCTTPGCNGIIKPDVVLYEESLDEDVISKTIKALSEADLLIIGGTSLTVYPAAGFIRAYRGEHLVLINRDPTTSDNIADLVIHAKIGEVLNQINA